MHVASRLAAVLLTLGLTTTMVGCGFHLKGTQVSNQPILYPKLNLALPQGTSELQKKLSVYLHADGIQLSQAKDANTLRVLEYNPRRTVLNGKLTEVLLRLTVTFQIEDHEGNPITQPRTLSTSRSFQYDSATVNTGNQEESYLNNIMINDIAQQIAQQVSSNRLPKVVK